VNDEEGDMEMAYSVAYQHTDSNRDHDGSDLVHGVKSEEWDCQKIWWSHYLFRISANSCAKVLEDWKKSSTFA
jgi:hypothetical protein